MANLVFANNVRYVSGGKLFSNRTNGVGDVGILTPDIEFSGIVGEVKVGEAVAVGDLLYPADAATPYYKLADPTAGSIKGPANAMALQAGSAAGDYVLAIFEGYVKYNSWLTTERIALKAQQTFTSTGVFSDDETITIDGTVFGIDIGDDGVAGADVLVVPAGTSQAQLEAVLTAAVLNANLTNCEVDTDWAANAIIVRAKNAGVAGNLIAVAEDCANAAWGAGTFAGGTDCDIVYCGDSGKPTVVAPATQNDMVQLIGQSISPTELMFRPITDYDLAP